MPRVALDQNIKCQNAPYRYYPAGVLLPPLPRGPNDKTKRDAAPGAIPKDPKATIVLCAPGSETFIKLTRKFQSDDLMTEKNDPGIQGQIRSLVADTYTYAQRERFKNPKYGDVVIYDEKSDRGVRTPGWIYERIGMYDTYKLQVANAYRVVPKPCWSPNGHCTMQFVGKPLKWGELNTALQILGEFMVTDQYGWTQCTFEIWDGPAQVGMARISPGSNYFWD
ncbi:MAG: hypothetical protein Q9213_003120 [Squamulea squamosa]